MFEPSDKFRDTGTESENQAAGTDPSRRTFLKASGLAGVGIASGTGTDTAVASGPDGETGYPGETLRVASYNIQRGLGEDDVYDLERTAEQIKTLNPDVIAIQEVDAELDLPLEESNSRSNFDHQPELLSEMLDMDVRFYPDLYMVSEEYQNQYGDVILSKYPILESNAYTYERNSPPGNIKEFQHLGETKIDVNGVDLWFYDTHLYWAGSEEAERIRQSQTRQTLDVTARRDEPRIVAGDFNFEPDSRSYELMTAAPTGYSDVLAEAGADDLTFPARDPNRRIDYIFASRHVNVEDGQVVDTQVSDHLPVVADVTVPDRSRGDTENGHAKRK